MKSAFLILLAFASAFPACTVGDWKLIPSTLTKYKDMANGKEISKERAEAVKETVCDTAKTDTTKVKK